VGGVVVVVVGLVQAQVVATLVIMPAPECMMLIICLLYTGLRSLHPHQRVIPSCQVKQGGGGCGGGDQITSYSKVRRYVEWTKDDVMFPCNNKCKKYFSWDIYKQLVKEHTKERFCKRQSIIGIDWDKYGRNNRNTREVIEKAMAKNKTHEPPPLASFRNEEGREQIKEVIEDDDDATSTPQKLTDIIPEHLKVSSSSSSASSSASRGRTSASSSSSAASSAHSLSEPSHQYKKKRKKSKTSSAGPFFDTEQLRVMNMCDTGSEGEETCSNGSFESMYEEGSEEYGSMGKGVMRRACWTRICCWRVLRPSSSTTIFITTTLVIIIIIVMIMIIIAMHKNRKLKRGWRRVEKGSAKKEKDMNGLGGCIIDRNRRFRIRSRRLGCMC
jgi:hypothetical protein